MFTGWRYDHRFPLNRPLTTDEKRDALKRDAAQSESWDDHFGLVALNSTYIEWVDRRFRARGSGSTFLIAVVFVGCVALSAFSLWLAQRPHNDPNVWWVCAAGSVVMFGLAILLYWVQLRIDFFQKVYWPIRFNRKNRMIYVYRDRKDGGILRVPWESVFFHVGYGQMNPDLCDIRGEVLDGDTVKDTFALGQYGPERREVTEMWAFICRYMEGGPEAVGPDPNDRYVELSLHGTWKDCALVAYSNYGAPNLLLKIVAIPFVAASTLTRWLVFKTCRMPKWPDDIEAACKVEPDDPNVWPQPRYTNQFVEENPAVRERTGQRVAVNVQRAWDAEGKSDLAKDMAGLEGLWQQRDRR